MPAAYIGVVLIWSTTPLAIKWSAEEVGFVFGVTGRMLLGVTASLILIALFRVELPRHREARQTYLAAGLGLFLGMLCVYWSSQFIPSGWISVVFGLAPLVTGLLATRWLPENALTLPRIAGMLLGLTGLGFIFAGGQGLGSEAGYGIVGVLLSVFFHSASAVAVKRINAGLSALAVTAGSLVVAVPLYLVVFMLNGESIPTTMPTRAALSIVYLGLVGSVLGFILYFYVLRRVEATRVALIALVTPVIALLLGNLLNREVIEPKVWGGALAIVLGLLLYEYGAKLTGWVGSLLRGARR